MAAPARAEGAVGVDSWVQDQLELDGVPVELRPMTDGGDEGPLPLGGAPSPKALEMVPGVATAATLDRQSAMITSTAAWPNQEPRVEKNIENIEARKSVYG